MKYHQISGGKILGSINIRYFITFKEKLSGKGTTDLNLEQKD